MVADNDGRRRPSLAEGFGLHGGLLLFLTGLVTMALAAFADVPSGVAGTMVVISGGLLVAGVFGHRLVGQFELGAQGFKGELLRAVEEKAEEKGIPPEEREQAIADLRRDLDLIDRGPVPFYWFSHRPSASERLRSSELTSSLLETFVEEYFKGAASRRMQGKMNPERREPRDGEGGGRDDVTGPTDS